MAKEKTPAELYLKDLYDKANAGDTASMEKHEELLIRKILESERRRAEIETEIRELQEEQRLLNQRAGELSENHQKCLQRKEAIEEALKDSFSQG